ncbi:MAG: hypothetical protein FJ276_15345, partial [Planctomycetes bacterium]|nr:hypothetical protein [Planctomycetota bacterium]
MRTHWKLIVLAAILGSSTLAAEDWPQFQYDSAHSGNAPSHKLTLPLGLRAAIPLTDAVYTSPAIVDGRIYALDGSGVLFCIDASTCKTLWKFVSAGGPRNCNNVSSPAVVGGHVHFGTTAGIYYVLNARDGSVVRQIDCGEPIFSCPVVGLEAVYFATLGSRLTALSFDGQTRWTWDYVREVLKFEGDRWSGQDWLRHLKQRVTWREQFLCSRDFAVQGKIIVLPAGGAIVWLEDGGNSARQLGIFAPNESPATLGLSLGPDGRAYRQWFRRDNTGRVEVLWLAKDEIQAAFVPGTETSYVGSESMGFSPVAIRDKAVYRCRPESRFGFCKHEDGKTSLLGDYPSITPPTLVGEHAVVCGLDGRLIVVPLNGEGDHWSFQTPFGRPITAPAAAADEQLVFGGEDGYLYILGPGGSAPLPAAPLPLCEVRSQLTSTLSDDQYNWDRHFADQANANRTLQGLETPLVMRWIHRCPGTIKHLSTFGGGRVYTHTAEGLITAAEQETGRLLWRVFYPGVHVSFTTPAYHQERLYLPQAGLDTCQLRCLDAATGALVWETPFSGSPSWNRQLTPIIHDGLIFYQFSTGRYTARNWLFE